ncbi:MAG: hypothetical protein L0K86_10965 [Actinomycetia bacterium]|nr:hypothetical protein [Actinomycetes bacterium]
MPAGPLRDHLAAATGLVRFAHATDAAEDALANEDLPLTVLPTADYWSNDRFADDPGSEPLADHIEIETSRRCAVVEQVRDHLGPSEPVMGQLVIASWLRAGRTKGQHQPHYADLLHRGVEVVDAGGLRPSSGPRTYLNERLADWLDRVLTGRSMTNSTTTMVEHEVAGLAHFASARDSNDADLQRVSDVVSAVGSRWKDTVETTAAAPPPMTQAPGSPITPSAVNH